MPEPLNPIHTGLVGIATGDAVGMPADVHRTVRSPWVRSRLWEGSGELSQQRVAQPLQPFQTDLAAPRLVGTDDTETAALALRAYIAVDARPDTGALFDHWRAAALGEDVWGGIAERAAARNAALGMTPPHTGHDHPADTSDSAVPAGIALGLVHRGDASAAAGFTRIWGQITHSRDGLDAAVFAAALTATVPSAGLEAAIGDARRFIADDTWLAAGITAAAEHRYETPAQLVAAIPELLATFSPRSYSSGSIAPETLPLALVVVRATMAQPELAVPLALGFARHADSLPAIVGGLTAAVHGSIPDHETWADEVDRLEGLFYPDLAGVSLTELSREALAVSRGSAEGRR